MLRNNLHCYAPNYSINRIFFFSFSTLKARLLNINPTKSINYETHV